MPIDVLTGYLDTLPSIHYMNSYPSYLMLTAYISANTPKGQKAPSLDDLLPPWATPNSGDTNPLLDDYLTALAVGDLGQELTRLFEEAGDELRRHLG